MKCCQVTDYNPATGSCSLWRKCIFLVPFSTMSLHDETVHKNSQYGEVSVTVTSHVDCVRVWAAVCSELTPY